MFPVSLVPIILIVDGIFIDIAKKLKKNKNVSMYY